MSVTCSVFGHTAGTTHHHNQGLDFAQCHDCGCDLIRSGEGAEWTEVPKGFRVVWREFGRVHDAASVAERMTHHVPVPPRREQRNARPKPPRDRRGKGRRPGGMFGVLRNLRGLLDTCDLRADTQRMAPNDQYVICLPGAVGR